MFLFWYFKWWTVSTHHIILFHMSCADILYSSMVIVGRASWKSEALCDFQGWILQSCGWISQLWCTAVGINLLLQMVSYYDDQMCRMMMRWYCLVIYGSGITTASIITFRGIIEPLSSWCWIGPGWPLDRLAFFYGPLWTVLIANVFIVGWIIRAFWAAVKNIPMNLENRVDIVNNYRWVSLHTSMFVITGMVIWLPGTVIRIWQIWEPTPPYTWLLLQMILGPSQGILNFLLYVTPIWTKAVNEAKMQNLWESTEVSKVQGDKEHTYHLRGRSKHKVAELVKQPGYTDEEISWSESTVGYLGISSPMSNLKLLKRQSLPPLNYGQTGKNQETSILPMPRMGRAQTHDNNPGPTKNDKTTAVKKRLSKLQRTFHFHNYPMVEYEDKLIPIWKVDRPSAGGPQRWEL